MGPLIVNGQVSASGLKALARTAQQGQPATGAGVSRLGSGFAPVHDRDDVFLAVVFEVEGTGADAKYSIREKHLKGGYAGAAAGDLEDRPSFREGRKAVNPARWAGYLSGNLSVGDLVLARRSVADANEWEILAQVVAAAVTKKKGKLDGTLSFGGSATMSVWQWNGSAEADTGENVTVYDWLLSSGQTVASGTQVTAFYDGVRWYLDGAQCA